MKERQIKSASKGGRAYSPISGRKDKTKWSEPSSESTTKRAELSKIAGTSQGSIQRTKLILEKGNPEQIERAERGGKGRNDLDKLKNTQYTPRALTELFEGD